MKKEWKNKQKREGRLSVLQRRAKKGKIKTKVKKRLKLHRKEEATKVTKKKISRNRKCDDAPARGAGGTSYHRVQQSKSKSKENFSQKLAFYLFYGQTISKL